MFGFKAQTSHGEQNWTENKLKTRPLWHVSFLWRYWSISSKGWYLVAFKSLEPIEIHKAANGLCCPWSKENIVLIFHVIARSVQCTMRETQIYFLRGWSSRYTTKVVNMLFFQKKLSAEILAPHAKTLQVLLDDVDWNSSGTVVFAWSRAIRKCQRYLIFRGSRSMISQQSISNAG